MPDADDKPRVFSQALEFLVDRVFVLRIDMANGKLRAMAPVIRVHGIEYERNKVQEKLDDGTLTLERATAWIRQCVRTEVAFRTVGLPQVLEGRVFVQVHSAAMVALVTDQATITKTTCPETLLLDAQRLGLLQRECHSLVTAMTLIVTASHAARDQPVLADIAALFVTSEMDLGETIDQIRTLLLRSTLSDDKQKTLLRALVQCASPTDAVHRLM
jgi:hypothetical protein